MASTRTVSSRPRRGRRVVAWILLTIGMFLVALLPVGWSNRNDELRLAELRLEAASQALVEGDLDTAEEETRSGELHTARAGSIAADMGVSTGVALVLLVPGTLLWRSSRRRDPAG
jgi:hypothetical protein